MSSLHLTWISASPCISNTTYFIHSTERVPESSFDKFRHPFLVSDFLGASSREKIITHVLVWLMFIVKWRDNLWFCLFTSRICFCFILCFVFFTWFILGFRRVWHVDLSSAEDPKSCCNASVWLHCLVLMQKRIFKNGKCSHRNKTGKVSGNYILIVDQRKTTYVGELYLRSKYTKLMLASRNTHQMNTRIWKFLFRKKLVPI